METTNNKDKKSFADQIKKDLHQRKDTEAIKKYLDNPFIKKEK